MTKTDQLPSVEQFLMQFPVPIRGLADELRTVIKQAAPTVIERVYVGWQVIGYRLPIGKTGRYLGFIHPQPTYASIGFEHGILLDDPDGILEGAELKQVRYVTCTPARPIPMEALLAVARQAIHVSMMPKPKRNLLYEAKRR